MEDSSPNSKPFISIKDKIRAGKKDSLLLAMRMMIGIEITKIHQKSFRRDEPLVLQSPQFIEAIIDARERLGITNTKEVPDIQKEAWLKKHLALNQNEKVCPEVLRSVLERTGLDGKWETYISKYIVDLKPSQSKLLFIPTSPMRIEDINEKGEIVVRLRPGLRYEDYLAAWKVFAKFIKGARLKRAYSNQSRDLAMLRDKGSGMSYREIALKYFPKGDPILHIDTVKKAVKRQNKILGGDK